MTIDETIEYALKLADEEEKFCHKDEVPNPFGIIRRKNNAAQYRQVAEWLAELKELRSKCLYKYCPYCGVRMDGGADDGNSV